MRQTDRRQTKASLNALWGRRHNKNNNSSTSVMILRYGFLSRTPSRLFNLVNKPEVFPEQSGLTEHIGTHRALVRLSSSVDTRVSRQTARPREPLPADRALVGLGTGVDRRVTVQLARPTERPTTL